MPALALRSAASESLAALDKAFPTCVNFLPAAPVWSWIGSAEAPFAPVDPDSPAVWVLPASLADDGLGMLGDDELGMLGELGDDGLGMLGALGDDGLGMLGALGDDGFGMLGELGDDGLGMLGELGDDGLGMLGELGDDGLGMLGGVDGGVLGD